MAILLLKHVPNHLSDMHGLILFKLGTSTVHDGIHVALTLFCDLIKDGRLAAILVVHKYGLALSSCVRQLGLPGSYHFVGA